VTVSTPEIDKYAGVVEIAHSREEFLAKLDGILSRPSSPTEIRRRIECVAAESWDARLNTVLEILQRRLDGKKGVGPDRPAEGTSTTPMRGQGVSA